MSRLRQMASWGAQVIGLALVASFVSPCQPPPDETTRHRAVVPSTEHRGVVPYRKPDRLAVVRRPTLKSAIELALPYMGDDHPAQTARVHSAREGAGLLRLWGQAHMGWSLLERAQDTELATLARDPAHYRGTIVCTRGTLRERDSLDAIVEVTPSIGRALRVRATFVHADMGAPLGQPVRICGVLTGGFSESGADGVEIVGMLDTPSSRAWVPLDPRAGDMDGEPPHPSRFSENVWL